MNGNRKKDCGPIPLWDMLILGQENLGWNEIEGLLILLFQLDTAFHVGL